VGTYTVSLAVTDNGGFTATASTTAMVSTGSNPQPPVSRPGGPYGGTASGAQVLHAYATAGTYTVTLSVTDDAGLTTSATTTATITAAANDGATLYSLNCADCHGNDARGGRTGERVVGAGANSIHEAIGEARAMRYLDCLPDGDVSQVSAYLKGLDRPRAPRSDARRATGRHEARRPGSKGHRNIGPGRLSGYWQRGPVRSSRSLANCTEPLPNCAPSH
jgi:mono/diheme cytochrome c family protein